MGRLDEALLSITDEQGSDCHYRDIQNIVRDLLEGVGKFIAVYAQSVSIWLLIAMSLFLKKIKNPNAS